MRYGFNREGFSVVDDAKKIGEFAYVSSPYWERACKDPHAAALEMLAKTWKGAPDRIRQPHYLLCCRELEGSTPEPTSVAAMPITTFQSARI